MYIVEKERKVDIFDSCDVFVAGGGIAGVSAALSAARTGAKVILAEKQCILGGLATAGLVTFYLAICDGMGRQVSFGLAEELLKLSIVHGADSRYPSAWFENGSKEDKIKSRYETQFNASLFALEMERVLLDAGVKILYDTVITNTCVEDNRINAIVVENKSGRCAYKVNKSVVDATGDGDIGVFSGAEVSNYSLLNVLSAWNYAFTKGKIELSMLGCADVVHDGEEGFPKPISPRRFTGINGEENSEMVTLSHQVILKEFIKRHKEDPTYWLTTIPTMPQLRKTRCIVGTYNLDASEMHKEFKDSVGLIPDWRKAGPVYEIPFGSVCSKDIFNLFSAGRCIGVTEDMWEITRVIPAGAVTGQAAGTAAALTDDYRKLDITLLQNALKEAGVVLHEKDLK